MPGITFPEIPANVKSNYAYMPVRFHDYMYTRDEIFDRLKAENIRARKYFYPCINAYSCYQARYDVKDTPHALLVSQEILTLPMYPDLALEDVDRICSIVLG